VKVQLIKKLKKEHNLSLIENGVNRV
jgi:hypothetical protein